MGLDVVVVGSGPNGLAAAVIFAAAGLSVEVVESQPTPGGGCRTVELDLSVPLWHDLCSAVHPMAAASEFFDRFGLTERGVELAQPEAAYAHPLDAGRAAIAYRSLDRTAAELGGTDGRLFRRVMAPLVDAVQTVRDLALSDMRSVPVAALTPRGIIAAASMAGRTLQLGTPAWERTTDAQLCGALLTGVAAHANTVIPSVAGGGTALLLGALAHSHGWPIPIGGSQSITDALIADLSAHGATIACNRHIDRAEDLPTARAYVFDTAPWTLRRVFGDRLSPRYRRALTRFRPGSGVAKVDFVVSEPIPWADDRVGLAGTVHLGGDRAQMARAEKETASGRHSDSPMILLSPPTIVDTTRRGRNGGIASVDVRTRAERLDARHDRDRRRANRAVRTRIPRHRRRVAVHPGKRVVPAQPQLRRRRHRRGPGFDVPNGGAADVEVGPVPDVDRQCLSVLGVNAARSRSPWHVRHARRRASPAAAVRYSHTARPPPATGWTWPMSRWIK